MGVEYSGHLLLKSPAAAHSSLDSQWLTLSSQICDEFTVLTRKSEE